MIRIVSDVKPKSLCVLMCCKSVLDIHCIKLVLPLMAAAVLHITPWCFVMGGIKERVSQLMFRYTAEKYTV